MSKWTVTIIESERGWGQRVDEVKTFKTKAEADVFVEEFNSHNNKATIPYWYMYAEQPVEVKS